MWIANRNLTLGLAAAAVLCGCGSGQHSGMGAKISAAAAAARAAKPHDTLVSAVAANKSTTLPVQVKFDLKQRPDVGQPVDVSLVIVPLSGRVERISGKVQVQDGLEIVDGAEIPPSDRPAEGVPIEHTVKVRPQRDGIFTFDAVVTVDAGTQSGTETYSMPVIAGAGLPQTQPKPAAAASAAPRTAESPSSPLPALATAASSTAPPASPPANAVTAH